MRQAAAMLGKKARPPAFGGAKDVQHLWGVIYSNAAAADGHDLRQRIMQKSRQCRKASPS
jgi:hypothetical protein